MIRTLTPNKAIVVGVSALVAYLVAATFVPPVVLRDVFNSLAFGVAVIITFTWGPAALRAVRQNAETGDWQLIIGIFLFWFIAIAQRAYIIAFNWAGRPDAWAFSAVPGFFPYAYMLAGLLFLTAPGVEGSSFSSRAIWAIVAAVGLGCLVAGILIGASIPTG